jgi:hypothetical protein
MGLRKKTIKLVNKVLHDPKKRDLYSEEEIHYMEKQVVLLEKERRARKLQRKREKGFGYE